MNERINELFEKLNPTDIQKQRVWESICEKNGAVRKTRHIGRTLLIAAAIVTAVVMLSLGINAASGGKLFEPFEKLLRNDTVVTQAAYRFEYSDLIYAPELVYVDDKTVVFAFERGVIVYDRERNEVAQAIDLQSIDCVYINSDPRNTCVLKDGRNIVIFNTENGTPYGSAYKFELAGEKSDINSYVIINSGSELAKYYEKWSAHQKKYVDSFDRFKWVQISGDAYMYSERALKWSSSDGSEHTSFITIDSNNVYELRTYSKDSSTPDKQTLELMSEEEKNEFEEAYNKAKLPKFKYTGDDMAVKAICEYRQKENEKYEKVTKHEVWIPAFNIIKRVEKGGELLVFGVFIEGTYRINGAFFEEVSAMSVPGCMHLVKKGEGYTVKRAEMAQDGGGYTDSINRMTEGFPDVRARMFSYDGNDNLEFFKMYIKNNRLKVRFLKHYGWDPISLED